MEPELKKEKKKTDIFDYGAFDDIDIHPIILVYTSRGVLKKDLRAAVGVTSRRAFREDVRMMLKKYPEAEEVYDEYKDRMVFPVNFCLLFIKHIFPEAPIEIKSKPPVKPESGPSQNP